MMDITEDSERKQLSNRRKLVRKVANARSAATKTDLMKAIMVKVLLGFQEPSDEQDWDQNTRERFALNMVGPAAASSIVDSTVSVLYKQGLTANVSSKLTHSYIHNVQVLQNDCPDWSSTLRQFLLPRYPYMDFDEMVDPRHRIEEECGYPRWIAPMMYRWMYDRDDVACRVNDIYPDESWGVSPEVSESDDNDDEDTPFEQDWKRLCLQKQLLQVLYRADKLSGVGHYGVILIGLNDGKDLEEPVDEPELLAGVPDAIAEKQREITYLRVFDEYLSFVQVYDLDVNSPRYGMPVFYNLVFVDMTIDAAGASIGTRINKRVHWTRVVHITDNAGTSLVFGVPRMQTVFNRLLDLRKVKGGSAEMFWTCAHPGLAFEMDPRVVGDNPEFDDDALKEEIEDYSKGLQRYLRVTGLTVKSLNPQVADPEPHTRIQLKAIAMRIGVPMRVFEGSEEGKLASSQDSLTWNKRLKRRLTMHVEVYIIRQVINRFVALGVQRPPKVKGKYNVGWDDLNTPTDEDKANLSLKWTQALSQYVSTGVIHLIPPMDYLTIILGLSPSNAKRMISEVQKLGGWQMLLKVDPSQAEGINGKASKTAAGKGKDGRQTSDKQAEGMTTK